MNTFFATGGSKESIQAKANKISMDDNCVRNIFFMEKLTHILKLQEAQLWGKLENLVSLIP